jgi:hypothetical protein
MIVMFEYLSDQRLAAADRLRQLAVRPRSWILRTQRTHQPVTPAAMLIGLVSVARGGLVVFAGLLSSSVHQERFLIITLTESPSTL